MPLTEVEVQALFSKLDQNGDGLVTASDFESAMAQHDINTAAVYTEVVQWRRLALASDLFQTKLGSESSMKSGPG